MIYKDINAYLKCIYDKCDYDSLCRIIMRPQRGISREDILLGKNNIIDIDSALNKDLYEPGSDIYKLLEELERMSDKSLYLSVKYILKKIGYEQFICEISGDNPDLYDEYNSVISNILSETVEMDSYFAYINFQKNAASNIKNNQSNIKLMTVHSSKGLEFDIVIIPDCNEMIFPHGRMPDEETVSEERRLFYVAMTRAKDKLYLTYLNAENNRNKYVSRFLNPLLKNSMLQNSDA